MSNPESRTSYFKQLPLRIIGIQALWERYNQTSHNPQFTKGDVALTTGIDTINQAMCPLAYRVTEQAISSNDVPATAITLPLTIDVLFGMLGPFVVAVATGNVISGLEAKLAYNLAANTIPDIPKALRGKFRFSLRS